MKYLTDLDTTIRQSNSVFARSFVTVSLLRVTEVGGAVIILDCIFKSIFGRYVMVFSGFMISGFGFMVSWCWGRFVGWSWGGLVSRGRSWFVGWGRGWFVGRFRAAIRFEIIELPGNHADFM